MFWLQSPAPEHKLHEGRNICIFCFPLYLQHLEWHRGRFKTAVNSLTSVLPLARFTEPRADKARLGKLEEDSGSTAISPGGSSQEPSKTTDTLRQDRGGPWPSGHAGTVRPRSAIPLFTEHARPWERGQGRLADAGLSVHPSTPSPKGAESVASY